MSSGTYCVIRDLGLVKGGKGLRHHENLLTLNLKGIVSKLLEIVRDKRGQPLSQSAPPPGVELPAAKG